ncbi:MAG: asparagine synthase C-terminal domain-containing protein [Candidatus Woesearchaeota archaeon]
MLPTTNETWQKWITNIESNTILTNQAEETYIQNLSNLLEETILNYANQAEKIGVLFSGGVDSTLISFILKKHKIPFTAISVGFHDNNKKFPDDLETARKVAKELNLNYQEVLINTNQAEKLIKQTINILTKQYTDVVNVGVGAVEIAGIEKLKQLNCTHVFSGLGSEEIFAGYDRHDKSNDPHKECWNGLKMMFERDMVRELKIAKHFNITSLTPFLDEKLIQYTMTIPSKYKINKENKKIILRKSAIKLGLNETFANRPKQAAQYGSRLDKAIENLTKKNKFQYKKDYLLSLFKDKVL